MPVMIDEDMRREVGRMRAAFRRWRAWRRVVDIPPLSQRDPAWRLDQLGTCPESVIGLYGCALTCVSMLVGWAGLLWPPGRLNVWLRQHGGYRNGCYLNWCTLEQLFDPTMRRALVFAAWAERVEGRLAWYSNTVDWAWGDPLETYLQLLNEYKIPIITEIDRDPSDPDLDQHFVLAIGQERGGGRIIVNDPWLYPAGRGTIAASDVWGFRLFVPVSLPGRAL